MPALFCRAFIRDCDTACTECCTESGIHGEGGAYGRISTPGVAPGALLRYDHVWNNGNEGKGKVTDTFSISRTKPHVWPLPSMPPPGPPMPPPYPGPPPTPHVPPAPPPAGKQWSCHDSKTAYCEDVGLTYGYLKGEGSTLDLCELASNGLANISALLFHGKYCHPCTGPHVTDQVFATHLKARKGYTACVLVPL